MKKNYFKILYILLAVCALLFLISYFLKNKLPDPSQINSSLLEEPIQSDAEGMEVITREEKGVNYQIQPLYNYELWGLIVSQNDNEVWYSRFKKTDPLNSKDFCVIWGENLKNDDYLKIKFKTEEFVCLFSYGSNVKFNQEKLSNNHLLYPNDELYKKIRQANIGDQIHFKGYLTSYKSTQKDGREMVRNTSSTRADTGLGACETVYADNFEIIKSSASNNIFRLINSISKYLFFILLFLIIILAFYNLLKPETEIKRKTGFVERNKKYKDLLPPTIGREI